MLFDFEQMAPMQCFEHSLRFVCVSPGPLLLI